MFLPTEIIKKKRDGQENTIEELHFFIQSYAQSKIPDYQMAAWLMAVFQRGMTPQEIEVTVAPGAASL